MKILYKIKAGSYLYGLTTPTSDIDYVGVYLEDTFSEHMDIFNSKDEIDLSVISKLNNGKNSEDAIDEKYYSLKKFLKLCSDCNPNIIELLYAPADCIEYVDTIFKSQILDHPELFINIKLVDRFIGYAKSQEQKSYTKSENYIILDKLKQGILKVLKHSSYWVLNELSPARDLFSRQSFMAPFPEFDNITITPITINHTATNIETIYEIGDMKFSSGLHLKNVILQIEDRFKRASHRVDGILINKYEPKFLSHTVRLLDEGCQLLTKKRIDFPFTEQSLADIMNIKLGLTAVQDIPNIVNKYKDTLTELEKLDNNIPDKPDYICINKAYLTLIRGIYNENI